MIKIYECVRKNTARVVTKYLGVTLQLNFENGNIYAGMGAQLVTNDKFVQDAIENDSRYGITFKLKRTIPEESDTDEAQEAQSRTAENGGAVNGKGRKAKKAGAVSGTDGNGGAEVIENVKTINDAVDYFAEQGVLVEDVNQIGDYCSKYNVSFPNLKQ